MTKGIVKLGPAHFTQEASKETFIEVVSRLKLKSPVIIKPNWSSSMIFSEAKILDWVLSAIDSEVLVVESYAAWRCALFLDKSVPKDDSLLTRLGRQTKEDFRENDKWFLNITRISDVLEKHSAEYVSLSEELWAKRLSDSKIIEEAVLRKYDPLENEENYSIIPERVSELQGGTLLNLTKPKRSLKAKHVSLSLKNLFGLIPSPWRGKYHGKNDQQLSPNIVDVNKVYHSLFDVKTVIEGVFTTSETIDNFLQPTIHRDMGLVWGSGDSLDLDALVTSQMGMNPHKVDYLDYANGRLGQWKEKTIVLGQHNLIEFPIQ